MGVHVLAQEIAYVIQDGPDQIALLVRNSFHVKETLIKNSCC
jgi:hypothetical protein